MSFGSRLWRVARGLGRRAGERIGLGRDRDEKRDWHEIDAEAQARADVVTALAQPPRLGDVVGAPPRTSAGCVPASEVSDVLAQARPAGASGTAPTLPPLAAAEPLCPDDSLLPCYGILALEPGSPMADVERAYQRLKDGNDAALTAAQPEAQPGLREKGERIEAAYQALRKALVPEKRL